MSTGEKAKCVKYTIYVFNVLFFILGLASLAVGLFILIDEGNLAGLARFDSSGLTEDATSPGLLYNTCVIFIVIGSLLVILSFVGCFGAVNEIKCVLALYAGFLGVLIALQVTSLALVVVMEDRFENKLEDALYKQLNTSYDNYYNSSDMFTKGYDYAMVYFECCGIRNYTEFTNPALVSKWSHIGSQTIPAHCCKVDKVRYYKEKLLILVDSSCPTTLKQSNTDTSCYDKISVWLRERVKILLAMACFLIIMEIIGMVLTCCLISRIKNPDEQSYKPTFDV